VGTLLSESKTFVGAKSTAILADVTAPRRDTLGGES
jgi:hypothetical protein